MVYCYVGYGDLWVLGHECVVFLTYWGKNCLGMHIRLDTYKLNVAIGNQKFRCVSIYVHTIRRITLNLNLIFFFFFFLNERTKIS